MSALQRRLFSTSRPLSREILDDFALLRKSYKTPKHPIVLAHGLLGFAELSIHPSLPPLRYWRSIEDALTANGCTVLTPAVPPSSSIQTRAAHLAASIPAHSFPSVNIIAHSMGGLDARYMISRLHPPGLHVAALVTIATPHRGSPVADYLLETGRLARLYGIMARVGLGTEAFEQLTTGYARGVFNPSVVDAEGTRYFSYGAATRGRPGWLNPFRGAYRIVERAEGANDGLVSVESSRWGVYKGTLVGVSHLDLVNWSNRLELGMRRWVGGERPTFDAVAFYMAVADMLAREGL